MENFVLAPMAECGRYIYIYICVLDSSMMKKNDCDSKAKGKKPGTS